MRDVYKLPNYLRARLEGVMRRQEQSLQTLQLTAGKKEWAGLASSHSLCFCHLSEMKVLTNCLILNQMTLCSVAAPQALILTFVSLSGLLFKKQTNNNPPKPPTNRHLYSLVPFCSHKGMA